MRQTILGLAFLVLLPAGAQAGLMLSTTNPPGSPLMMTGGTTSGLMDVTVVSDNPPNDVMAAWMFRLVIVPDGGAMGTLTFQDPATGTPPNPSNYVFDGNGLGIVVTNAGTQLDANDFFDPTVGPGAAVPGSPGANLLEVDFLASANASGSFGIYAVGSDQFTDWTDSNQTTQFYTNVPDGTDLVLIGEVSVPQAVASVPEPSALALFGIGGAALVGWMRRRR